MILVSVPAVLPTGTRLCAASRVRHPPADHRVAHEPQLLLGPGHLLFRHQDLQAVGAEPVPGAPARSQRLLQNNSGEQQQQHLRGTTEEEMCPHPRVSPGPRSIPTRRPAGGAAAVLQQARINTASLLAKIYQLDKICSKKYVSTGRKMYI